MLKKETVYLILGFLLVLPGTVFSQPEAPAVAGPMIEFVSPTYDFGRIMAGPDLEVDFIFKNTGTDDLKISGIRPSCGCTVSDEWDRLVKPGETGKIPIVFKTAPYRGSVKHSFRVTTNVPDQQTVTLYLQGQLWQPIEMNPRSAYLGANVKKDAVETRTIEIKSNLDEPVQILDVRSNNDKFAAEIQPVEEGKHYNLIISSVPPLDEGANRADFTIRTSNEQTPVLKLTASCYVQPPVKVQPQRIMVPAGALDRAAQRVIHVSSSDGSPLKLSDLEITCKEQAEVSMTDIAEGRRYRILVQLQEGFEIQPGESCLLRFKTDDPAVPLVEIPFHQVQVPQSRPGSGRGSGS